MYANDVDVIFHAAGNAGNGVNTETRNRLESGQTKIFELLELIVTNQKRANGKKGNFVLTSTLKELGRAAENEANDTMDDNFHGGEHIVSNLEDGDVGVVKTSLSDEIKKAVAIAEQQIIYEEINVPESLQ